MFMKKTHLILSMLMLSLSGTAQTKIVYTYDANGNRISRSAAAAKAQTRSKLNTVTEPTADRLTVEIPRDAYLSACTITLCDLSGNVIVRRQPASHAEAINIKELHTGVYIINISVNGKSESHKFVKR